MRYDATDRVRFAALSLDLLNLAAIRDWTRSLAICSALETYGSHGPLISGSVRDHFPTDVKMSLRKSIVEVSGLLERSRVEWSHAGRRRHTWTRAKDAAYARTKPEVFATRLATSHGA